MRSMRPAVVAIAGAAVSVPGSCKVSVPPSIEVVSTSRSSIMLLPLLFPRAVSDNVAAVTRHPVPAVPRTFPHPG